MNAVHSSETSGLQTDSQDKDRSHHLSRVQVSKQNKPVTRLKAIDRVAAMLAGLSHS